MAKKSTPRPEADDDSKLPGMLPVPDPVIRHHAPSLASAMREWKGTGRLPPVLLLTGTSGIGKRSMSYWLAQWILCEREGFGGAGAGARPGDADDASGDLFGGGLFGGDADPAEAPTPLPAQASATPARDGSPGPCGECPSCQRAIKGNWVDFTEVLPEDSGEGSSTGSLKVDQFREIKQKLGFGAHEGAYRIVLIPNADRMTVQAANSLLKLLEEPPPGWVFFLTASDPTLVLPTILSRCQKLRLKPFQPEELEELLELGGVNAGRSRICGLLAQGSWSRALALADDETWEQRQNVIGFLKEPAAGLAPLVDWAAQEPGHFDFLVDQLEQLTGELIRWSVSPAAEQPEIYPWVSGDGKAALIAHAKGVTKRQGSVSRARAYWTDRALRLARARQEALAPLNRKLLIQDLLLPWLQAM